MKNKLERDIEESQKEINRLLMEIQSLEKNAQEFKGVIERQNRKEGEMVQSINGEKEKLRVLEIRAKE